MLLIVEGWDAERNAAASKPESENAAKKADEPGKSTLFFVNMCHASLSTSVASNFNWVFRPDMRVTWMAVGIRSVHYHNLLCLWLLWCHDVLNGLTIWSDLHGWLLDWLPILINTVW